MRYDTEEKISELYYTCRHSYFKEYALKTPRFHSGSSLHDIGWIRKIGDDVCIGMSKMYYLDENIAIDVMSHEIVHYILMKQGEKNWKEHNEKFLTLAGQINEKFGLKIEAKKDVSPTYEDTSLTSCTLSKLFDKIKSYLF